MKVLRSICIRTGPIMIRRIIIGLRHLRLLLPSHRRTVIGESCSSTAIALFYMAWILIVSVVDRMEHRMAIVMECVAIRMER